MAAAYGAEYYTGGGITVTQRKTRDKWSARRTTNLMMHVNSQGMWKCAIHATLITALSAVCGQAGTLAIVSADASGSAAVAQAALLATGKFDAVDLIDAYGSSPDLAALSGYDAVLAYSNRQLWDPSGLGDVLAQYYDLGGKHLTLATFAFSGGPVRIGGAMGSGDYVAFTFGGTGDVSGSLVATVPSDPIFADIDLANVAYPHNINFAHPDLVSGATLLATDGNGVDMIARSANGVIDVNIYPGSPNGVTFDLLANTLTTPEPNLTVVVLGALIAGFRGLRGSRR